MERPKISVIIPVYNVENYVEEAIDSVVNQTIFDETEVIIVDDGSTDNSRFIISKYEQNYDNVKIVRKENGGLSSARNCGMKYINGEYIHFFDSDDYILPYAYEKLYDLAKKNDLDVCIGNYLRFNEEKTWKHHTPQFVFKDIDGDVELTDIENYPNLTWDMLVWNKIYKREFLEKNDIKFIEGITFEDNIFSTEIYAKTKKVGVYDNYICGWRLRESNDSITQSFTMQRTNDLINVFHTVNELLESNFKNKEVLRTKYFKWLTKDVSFFIETIKDYPEKEHEQLFENIYEVYNLIPQEFTENLSSYYSVLYKMLKNKDWESLLLYTSNNYRHNPKLPENLKEEYKKDIDFRTDIMDGDLDIYTTNISKDGDDIVIKFNYYIPYFEKTDDFTINVKIVNSNYEDILLDSKYIDKYQFRIPSNLLNLGKSGIIMSFKSGEIEKEYYLKIGTRKNFSFDDWDVDVLRGRASDIRIIKREKNDVEYLINEVIFKDGEYFKLKGISNSTNVHASIIDYLDFSEYEYPIDYDETISGKYEFSIQIPYRDFLKAPIKRWDFFIGGKFNKINLDEDYEFINEQYRIYLKNFGNRITLELKRYDPIETIENLNNESKILSKEKSKLEKERKKLSKEKSKLEKERKKLSEEENRLKKETNELIEKNKSLENKIKEYENRKDVKTVNKMKRILKK